MAKNLIIFSNSSINITNLRNNFLSFLSSKGYNVTVSIPDTENKKNMKFSFTTKTTNSKTFNNLKLAQQK